MKFKVTRLVKYSTPVLMLSEYHPILHAGSNMHHHRKTNTTVIILSCLRSVIQFDFQSLQIPLKTDIDDGEKYNPQVTFVFFF
jgi:hypothetical protein